MKNVLIINAAVPYLHAKGELGASMCLLASNTLKELGFNVEQTNIANAYNIDDEINKLLKADIWIWQIPAWWMGEPWHMKKYIDEVFTQSKGSLYLNDGRSRKDASKTYGSSIVKKNKYYMFSWTWNMPASEFSKDGYFGVDIDNASLHLHKIFEFLGLNALKTFMCNDVVKNPDIKKYHKDYKEHLINVFKNINIVDSSK